VEKGEIWIVKFPSKRGREQEGTRPVIVIADTQTDLALIILLTSNIEALRKFLDTIGIEKSNINKLDKKSVALVFQLQALDKKRFISKIGALEDIYLEQVNEKLRQLLKL
jgi:mRNA interferase MazF